jgi:hypothetical protein
MMKWRRRLVLLVFLLGFPLVTLMLGYQAFESQGMESLRLAGSRLEKFQELALKRPGDRPSVSSSEVPGNAAAHYREILDPALTTKADSLNELIQSFFEGEEVETSGLERAVTANDAVIQTLREGVRSTRCDWDVQIAVRRTCGLGGATLARVGYNYKPWTFGLYYQAPRLAAAGELARRRGNMTEALELILESMGVCLDMTRGTDSFNARMVPVRLERLCALLILYSKELKGEDSAWDRTEAALDRLGVGSEELLSSWKSDLLLAMYGEVYLPTYGRITLQDRGESDFSRMSAVYKHLLVTLGSRHASAARLFSLYEDLWRAMEKIPMAYDPECLARVEEAVRIIRTQDILLRDGVDNVLDAVVSAFRLEAALRMSRIAWRLARHRRQTGEWPEHLDAMAIPVEWKDPFTGKIFGYSRDKGPVLSSQGHRSERTHLPHQPLTWTLPP